MFKQISKILAPYKTVLSNTIYLSLINIVYLLMPFIALPYIIKTVGAENYGKIALAQAISSYFLIFINFGLDIVAVKKVAQNRISTKRIGIILGAVLTIKTLLCIFAFAAFLGLIFFWSFARENITLFLYSFLACITDIIFTAWLFQGIEKMFMITAIKASSLVLYIGLIFIFLNKNNDYIFIPLFQSGALLFTSIVGFVYMTHTEKIYPRKASTNYLRKLFKESFAFFLSRSAVVVNNSLATVAVGIALGPTQVAIYDLSQKIARTGLTPVVMLSQAIYPHNAKHRNKKFALKAFYGLLSISIIGLIILYIIAPYLVYFLSGNKLMDAVPLVRFFGIYVFFGIFSIYLGLPLLVAWGHPKPFNNSVYISSGVLLIVYGSYELLSIHSVYFYSLALAISEFVLTLYRGYFCHKYKII